MTYIRKKTKNGEKFIYTHCDCGSVLREEYISTCKPFYNNITYKYFHYILYHYYDKKNKRCERCGRKVILKK